MSSQINFGQIGSGLHSCLCPTVSGSGRWNLCCGANTTNAERYESYNEHDEEAVDESRRVDLSEQLTSLPRDVLVSTLSFLKVSDVDGPVKLVCRSIR